MSQKTFRQKYRVFSAAFWQSNGNPFDVEKSDKVVLPPSALNALTECNASLPVLLKIQRIDASTNKPLPSNIFSYVIDYSAPEGLIYMSSWMISKLKLKLDGESVVELSLPTKNNLMYQCPTADFIKFQPHNKALMSLDNMTEIVHKSLSEYYSSLRVNDIILIYHKNNLHKLTVKKISGTNIKYTPKVVTITNDAQIMLGFAEPPQPPQQQNNNINLNDDDKKINDQQIKDTEYISDGEWEIISVEKVQSLSDLEWKIPSNDDIKQPPDLIPNIKEPEHKNEPEQKNQSPPNKDKPIQISKPKPKPITTWECVKCSPSSINELSYKFCPSCGSRQVLSKPKEVLKIQPKSNKNNEIQGIVLQKLSVLNDGAYDPSEKRETGWIMKNISKKILKCNAKIQLINGDSDVKIEFNKKLDIELEPDGEQFILLSVTAPSLPNQYHMFYEIVLENNDKIRICDVLQLPILVKKKFNDEKEKKIANAMFMGFSREKSINALKKWSWDECKAANWLCTH